MRTSTSLLAGVTAITLGATAAAAQRHGPPTFYRDVLPILQANCQDCHRPEGLNLGGMVAPMPLMTYDDALPWSRSISLLVEIGYMPPWHASRDQEGVFANERFLTDAEINTIRRWVAAGTLEGDASDAPAPRNFGASEGWSIGEPDLILTFDEPFWIPDSVQDLYVNLPVRITKDKLPEDRWLKAVEFRAGSKAVHHVIAGALGGIAPGYPPRVYAQGHSALLETDQTLMFQMHYHKLPGEGTGMWDQTQVALKFYEPGEIITHVLETEPLGMYDFVIPARDSAYTFSTSHTFAKDVNLMWLNPHMHLRGKAARYVATFPDGSSRVLLDVPRYDFNWQHMYQFKDPVHLPAGTKVDLTLWWDNSSGNPANPNPNREVRWGEPTTDEMGFGFAYYVEAEPRRIVAGEPVSDEVRRMATKGPLGN